MIFKKKRMVDLRELQKKGLISPIKKNSKLEIDQIGFIDLSTNKEKINSNKEPVIETPNNFFGFMNSNQTTPFTNEKEGYNKREVDNKIESLDNKIYKLEQRIELLERKVGLQTNNQQNNSRLW